MKPELLKRLAKHPRLVQEIRLFLAQAANELNTLEGLDGLEISARAYEVTARLRAYEKLQKMLAPLVNLDNPLEAFDPKEYVS